MNVTLFHTLIFAWFQKNGRILPWREKIGSKQDTNSSSLSLRDQTLSTYFTNIWKRDPYKVAVSEIMLQQTQVDRVLPKFEEFLSKWPTIQDLASASLSEVLIAWQGLGYNRRARFLHEMAKAIVLHHKGKFPETEAELVKLPGIGQYTSRAILTFAYGLDVGVIDTNIQRIFARVILGVEQNQISKTAGIPQKEFIRIVDESVPKGKGDPWNQSLMDFGALVCVSRSPKCTECPLQTICKANVEARKQGFDTYANKLATELKENKISNIPSPKVKFQDSDRYFRGRIVDKLREGPVHMEELRQHLEKNHGLEDRMRWGMIVEKLVIDNLIQVRGSTVSLP